QQLQETVSAAERAARESAPAARPSLETVRTTARGAVAALRGGPSNEPPPPAELPPAADGRRDLLGLLVAQGLRRAEDDDPLCRADYCADIGDSLAQTILLADGPDAEEAGNLGRQLGDVLDRGVAANLRQVDTGEDDAERLAEFRRVSERGSRAVAVLRQKL